MAKVIHRLNLKRESGFMYYIKDGGVWSVPMKRPGKPKGKKKKIAQFAGPGDLDYSKYLYFIDKGGNIAASPRGAKKKAKKK